MTYSFILTELRPPQGRIIINVPEKRNALSTVAVGEIASAVRELDQEPSARVIVITGAGDFFSAGADLRIFENWTPLEDRAEYNKWLDLHLTVARASKPVIALVNGPAVGGSYALVGLCDMAIASERAWFAFVQIERGIGIGVGVVTALRCAPFKKTVEMALRAHRVDAYEAERLGLVNRVVAHEELEPALDSLVADLVRKSPLAIAFTKEALYALKDLPYAEALERCRDIRVLSRTSADAHEGMAAFLEKRRPVWTGK